jgi:hypothetical protein
VTVDGTVQNGGCAASAGDYRLTVRVRDANAETQTLEFVEAWHRADDQPVPFKHDYAIGENVDLLTVRPRSLHCTCTEPPVEPPAPPAPSELPTP